VDFSRAKTVLIAAFLILNAFLLYQLWQAEGGGETRLFGGEEEHFRLEEALEEANLTLETSLPRDAEKSSHLEVTPWNFEEEEVAEYLEQALQDGGKEPVEEVSTEQQSFSEKEQVNLGREYGFEDYKMDITPGGTLILEAENFECDIEDPPPQEEIKSAAEKFVGHLPFMDDFALDYITTNGENLKFYYHQEIDNAPLFSGYAELVLCGELVLEFSFYRVEKQEFAEPKRQVIPPSSALMRFVEEYKENDTPGSIVDFQQGYYSKKYDAERWEIPPVWRIRLDSNEYYYVNAFTGNLEE